MTYDPRDHGARCDVCPLGPAHVEGGWIESVVPPEIRQDAIALVIGSFPADDEIRDHKPFVGRSGRLALETFALVDVHRVHLSITNAILCPIPEAGRKSALERFMHKLDAENRRRSKTKLPLIPDPFTCCYPRLEAEARQANALIPMGAPAFKAFAPRMKSVGSAEANIAESRGSPDVWIDPVTSREIPILPTFQPAFLFYFKRWTRQFRIDVARAVRMATGRLEIVDPHLIWRPSPEEAANWIDAKAKSHGAISYDWETTKEDSLYCKRKCVGLSDDRCGIVIPFMSVEGEAALQGMDRFYSKADQDRLHNVYREFLTRRDVTKIGWNAGMFDAEVDERFYGATATPFIDGIMAHHLIRSEYPHKLGDVGREYLDIRPWKKEKGKAETDLAEAMYCITDCVATYQIVTAHVWPSLETMAAYRVGADAQRVPVKVTDIYETDRKVQEICRCMHRNGISIDDDARDQHRVRLHNEIDVLRVKLRAAGRSAGVGDEFNPGSTQQVAAMLYDYFGIEIDQKWAFTDLGDPSTKDRVLREILLGPYDDRVRSIVKDIRSYRSAVKMLGNYVDFPVGADGRVHAGWNAHVTIPGRRSCSQPNLQVIPQGSRDIFCAGAGRSFVYGDKSQLHPRIIAALSGDEMLRRVFTTGGDKYIQHAKLFYGQNRAAAAQREDKAAQKQMRQGAKISFLAMVYLALLPTVYATITATEDDSGEMIYRNLSMRVVRMMYDKFWSVHKAIFQWGMGQVDLWKQIKYLCDPFLGRPCEFLDGEDVNQIVNYGVLAGEQGLVIPAMIRLAEAIPFEYAGPGTGIVHDNHDSLVVEVPDADVPDAIEILEDCMHQDRTNTEAIAWTDIPFPSEIAVGKNLGKWHATKNPNGLKVLRVTGTVATPVQMTDPTTRLTGHYGEPSHVKHREGR